MRFTLPISIAMFVAACASIKTFNMPKVEDDLSRAFQKSEEISADMKNDFEQKKSLMDTLRKSKSPKFKEIEPELKNKMTNLDKLMAQAAKEAKVMMQAKGDISSLSYSRKEIKGDEPEYARVEETVKQFETAAADFTQTASEYSRVTNSLADLVAVKKLYFNFDVAEFQKKVQKSLDAARENFNTMEREIKRAEEIRASFEDESRREPVEQALAQMNMIAKDHANRWQELSNSLTEMGNLAKGQAKIASTATNWSDVQRVVSDSDRSTFALNELFKDFQLKVERIRKLPKAGL